MPTIYLCGGIKGLTDYECKNWRETAKTDLDWCSFLDPMVRDCRGIESMIDPAQLVADDLKDIAASDVVLVNAMRPSWGTAMEIVYAHILGKIIVAFTADEIVSPWLRKHTIIVESYGAAIEWIDKAFSDAADDR